jgi:hypothetical protein
MAYSTPFALIRSVRSWLSGDHWRPVIADRRSRCRPAQARRGSRPKSFGARSPREDGSPTPNPRGASPVASPKRPLTANEVEADPAMLRHPDAREKTRNRSGQKGGASKLTIEGTFAPRLIEMMDSPAYRVMSLSCHRFISRLEIEFERTHHRNPFKNGEIVCTTDQFAEYGINRNQIAPARREAIALGFVRVTRPGSAGNSEYRQPAQYLLTCRAAGSNAIVENGWSRIKTLEEAEAVAKAAREGKADPRASEFGRRGGKARWARDSRYGNRTEGDDEKKISSHGNRTDVGTETVLKGGLKNRKSPDFLGTETVPLSRLSQGRVSVVEEGVSLMPPPIPPSLVLWAEFSPSMPRRLASVAIAAPRNPDTIVEPIDGAYLIGGRRIEIRDQAARRNVVSLGLLRTRQRASSSIGSTASARHSASADAR